MVQYAIGNAFALRDTLELLPELQRYRGEAESIARRAAGLGSVNALAALAAAYWPASGEAHRTSLLAQAVDQDPVEALALYLVLQAGLPDEEGPVYTRETRHVINDRVTRLRDALPPADQASAAQRASELQSEWGALEVEQVNGELLLDGTFRGEFPRLLCDAALADKLM